jgi:hypothetical protein
MRVLVILGGLGGLDRIWLWKAVEKWAVTICSKSAVVCYRKRYPTLCQKAAKDGPPEVVDGAPEVERTPEVVDGSPEVEKTLFGAVSELRVSPLRLRRCAKAPVEMTDFC